MRHIVQPKRDVLIIAKANIIRILNKCNFDSLECGMHFVL